MKKINQKEFIWVEKYRPQCVEDLIITKELKDQINSWINDDGQIPNLAFFSNQPGTGKTSISKAVLGDLDADSLFINASKDNGIDMVRSKIADFASAISFTGNPKVVVLDECLHENEKVILGTLENKLPTSLKDMEKDKVYDCISFNMQTKEFENDTCEVISDKVSDDVYVVTLEDGSTITLTGNHPFIVNSNSVCIEKSINNGLQIGDDIEYIQV